MPAKLHSTVDRTNAAQPDVICILGDLVVVPSKFGQRFAAGHVVEGGRHLFVATGVGTSILPVRFRVAPAVTLLTLRREK
jgi:predicted MPP superfamily phosphohydrolase